MSGLDLDRYIELYRRTVTDTALFIVKNPADAEDIAQDVFLKLFTYQGSFNSDEHIKAWLIRCTINHSFNHLKSHWNKNYVSIDSLGEMQDNKTNDDNGVRTALMSLNPKLRTTLYLYYYEGYGVAEIAGMLRISAAAVKWRLKRGRDKLRNVLDDERSIDHGL